jgi:thiamine kinase-like enzyme
VDSNSPSFSNFSDIVVPAQAILQRYFRARLSLQLADVIWEFDNARSTVVRCRVFDAPGEAPKTVVIKRSTKDRRFTAYECSVIEFLASFSSINQSVPVYYGFDSATGVGVMEDLGADGGVLLGHVQMAEVEHELNAVEALKLYLRTLAHVHGATQGKDGEFQKLLKGRDVTYRSEHKSNELRRHVESLPTLLSGFDITVPPSLRDETRRAIDLLECPGPFLTLIHGDATFGNVFIKRGRAVMIDLETSRFRHCLLDGALPVIRYIWSAWCFRIPDNYRHELLEFYRQELSTNMPAANDEKLFEYHLTACATAWLAGICSIIPDVIEKDEKWGRVTKRQRVMLALENFTSFSLSVQYFPSLFVAVKALAESLHSKWRLSAHDVPIYPAM